MPSKPSKTAHTKQPHPEHRELSPSRIQQFLSGDRAVWVYAAVYFLVTVVLFRSFLFSSQMLYGSDTIPDGIYTRLFYKNYFAEYHAMPRWNPFILGGLPFIDAMHGDTFYPGAWLQFILPITRALGHKLIWHVFLAGLTMYGFLRTIRVRREAAFLGGLMYLLAPSFVSLLYPAHDAKMYVIAWLPAAFAQLERLMTRPRIVTAALLGALMGLLILTSHIQMAYYAYWALGLYFLFRLFTGEQQAWPARAGRTGLFVGAVVIAVMLGAIQLLPAYKFTTGQSVRAGGARTSYEYATSFSMHPEEVAGMIVPSFPGNDFFDGRQGGRYGAFYWGRNFFKLNSEYNGILPIVFAVLALVLYRRKETWFYLGLSLFAVVYALGAHTPVYRLFYALVPGVKNFRAPGMIIFLFAFAAVVMASRFLSALFDREDRPGRFGGRGSLIAIGAMIGAALLVTGAGESFFAMWRSLFFANDPYNRAEVMQANIPFVITDLWRVVLLASIALAGARLYALRRIGPAALTVLLAAVTITDQGMVDSRFIVTINPNTFSGTAPDSLVPALKKELVDDGPFRVLDLAEHAQNYYAQFGIQLAGGSHNNELQSYELYRGANNERFLAGWVGEKGSVDVAAIPKNPWLNVAGVRYALFSTSDGDIAPVDNPAALDRAFIVHDWVTAPSDTAAVLMMGGEGFDPARTAVIGTEHEVPFAPSAGPVTGSRVTALDYGAGTTDIAVEMAAPGLVVLTDNMVPYWRAAVDGAPVPVHRAYGTFMAVAVPEGEHRVEFTFYSGPYHRGKMLTLTALGIVVLVLAAGAAAGRFRAGRGCYGDGGSTV